MKNKNQLIGCCGLDCEKCDARIATIKDDNALSEQTATLWTKLNGVTICLSLNAHDRKRLRSCWIMTSIKRFVNAELVCTMMMLMLDIHTKYDIIQINLQ